MDNEDNGKFDERLNNGIYIPFWPKWLDPWENDKYISEIFHTLYKYKVLNNGK